MRNALPGPERLAERVRTVDWHTGRSRIDVRLSKFKNRGDGRETVVQFRLDHSSFVNNDLMPVEGDLRRQIAGLMATRQEQVLFFAADDQLTYREVSAVLSDLLKDSPALNVVLLTKRQVDVEQKPHWIQLSDYTFRRHTD